jgi:protein TonB
MPQSLQRGLWVAIILALHVLGLWAFQTGLVGRVVGRLEEVVTPVMLIAAQVPLASPEKSSPTAPKSLAPTPVDRPPPPAFPVSPVSTKTPATPSLAIGSPPLLATPPSEAGSNFTAPQAAAPQAGAWVGAPNTFPTTAPSGAASAPTPPSKIDLPSSDAAYLNNPKPPYPALSRRLGEQGKVVIRVLIGADGKAQQAQVHSSSGFDRLDQAGLQTVLKWQFEPGKRGGMPEAMWFNVPLIFKMD